jgi:pimeloyl-ACP methyl ester carboxylesterase/DNA-binding CsgD family transcriptional regulator
MFESDNQTIDYPHVTMEPAVAHTRSADGVSIAWTAMGAGPALVLMPGVPFSNFEAEWRIPVAQRAFTALARSVRLIQYDGRGTGRSQRDVPDVSFEAMLADVDAVLDAAAVRSAVLLGFYHSCTHAIAYAARHAGRVAGLVLFGGSVRGWDPMSGTGIQALLSLIERDWNTFVESATHAWLGWPSGEEGRLAAEWFRTATTPAVARATLQAASAVDVSREAGLVRCPALVLHREEASVIPLAMSEELAAALPRARLEVLPGTSASLLFETTDEVVATLIDFALRPSTELAPSARPKPPNPAAKGFGLSPREMEVLRLLTAGDTNGQIAARLELSVNTVERHVGNVYRKLDVRGRAEATALAVRRGLA